MSIEALLPYVHHKFDCYSLLGIGNCTCGLSAALKAAQPQEYPSSADDEATRWRHGEPTQKERVSVPREPTQEMLDAICSVRFKQGAEVYREIYKTMIAAAQEGK